MKSNNNLYARVSYKRSQPKVLDSGLPAELTGYRVQVRMARQVAISDTWTITPTSSTSSKPVLPVILIRGPASLARSLSINWEFRACNRRRVENIPSLTITGFQTMTQIANAAPAENTFQFVDQITHIRGRHTIKAGVEYRPQQYNDFQRPSVRHV